MQNPRQFGIAAAFAVASACLVIGGLTLALVESGISSAPSPTAVPSSPTPSPTQIASPTSTRTPFPTVTVNPTITIAPSGTPLVLVTPSVSTSSPTSCPHPAGWIAVHVQSGDTIAILANRYRTTSTALLVGNCLTSEPLLAGALIFVPPLATSTASVTSRACVPGSAGWSKSYLVAPGDTLFRIASSYYTTVTKLKQVNCRTTDVIRVGEVLWVPNVATRTPTFGYDPFTPQPTDPLTSTPLPFTGTPLPFTSTPELPPT